mgnify:CR=1 FL=1
MNSTEATEPTLGGVLSRMLQKYLPYIIAIVAGSAGYGGGNLGVVEKCVGGVMTTPPQAVPAAVKEAK